MSLKRFVEIWTHPEYPPTPVDRAELERIEGRLGPFPGDYRDAVLSVGLPRPTIGLLHSIVEGGVSLSDVSNFLSPAEAEETTLDWREMGLANDLTGFATDCSGNLFCFKDGGPSVWLFDHDFGTTEVVAPSFSDWIQAFCEIDPVPWDT